MPIEAESPEELGYARIRANLAESSVADTPLGELGVELDELVLQYGDHRGRPGLRTAIAAGAAGIGPDHVLVTPGAAAALFIVHTALLGPGDELVVVRPNYATNLETPRAIGANVRFLDLRHEEGWALDVDRLAGSRHPPDAAGVADDAAQPDRPGPLARHAAADRAISSRPTRSRACWSTRRTAR